MPHAHLAVVRLQVEGVKQVEYGSAVPNDGIGTVCSPREAPACTPSARSPDNTHRCNRRGTSRMHARPLPAHGPRRTRVGSCPATHPNRRRRRCLVVTLLLHTFPLLSFCSARRRLGQQQQRGNHMSPHTRTCHATGTRHRATMGRLRRTAFASLASSAIAPHVPPASPAAGSCTRHAHARQQTQRGQREQRRGEGAGVGRWVLAVLAHAPAAEARHHHRCRGHPHPHPHQPQHRQPPPQHHPPPPPCPTPPRRPHPASPACRHPHRRPRPSAPPPPCA